MARLSRDDWVDAAYTAFTGGGIGAVRVEAVARALGATKGSFYWHFAGREELLTEVLTRWEHVETEQIIDDAEAAEGDVLANLIELILVRMEGRGGELTLFHAARDEGIEQVVAAITERRVGYITQILIARGVPAAEAAQRGAVVVAALVGLQQLYAGGWSDPDTSPRALVDTIFAMALRAPVPASSS